MSLINFKTVVFSVNGWLIALLPQTVSDQLSSRSPVMVKGTINGRASQQPLEPDGKAGHWLRIDEGMQKSAGIADGETVEITFEVTKDWPEPEIPADVRKGIVNNPTTKAQWADITPLARWEWLRWIDSTLSQATRAKRIEVSGDKLRKGERRPCCFNCAMCCVPQVSKSGVLQVPAGIAK